MSSLLRTQARAADRWERRVVDSRPVWAIQKSTPPAFMKGPAQSPSLADERRSLARTLRLLMRHAQTVVAEEKAQPWHKRVLRKIKAKLSRSEVAPVAFSSATFNDYKAQGPGKFRRALGKVGSIFKRGANRGR